MRKITQNIVLLAIFLSGFGIYGQLPGTGWQLEFEEQFKGRTLNRNNWTFRTDGTLDEEALVVGQDKLTIKSSYSSNGVVSGGWVQSKKSYGGNERYGYYEARVRLSGQSNGDVWATWWLWGGNYRNGGPAPSATELDIFEYSGNSKRYFRNQASSSHHYFDQRSIDGNKNKTTRPSCTAQRDSFNWHTWGVLWTPTEISYFYDGKRFFKSDQPSDAAADIVPTRIILSASPHGYKIPGYNVDAGGRQPNNPVLNPDDRPQRGRKIADFEIDWVRIWRGGVVTDSSNSCEGGGSVSNPPPAEGCNYTIQSGKGLDIGAYGANVYLVGTDNYLYRSNGNGQWDLINSSKKIKRIDVSALEDVWAIGMDNKLWQFSGGVWLDKNGTGIDVGVGANDIFIIGMDNRVRKYTGNGTYSQPYGNLNGTKISVSGNNIPWIRGADGGLYQWVGNTWHRKGTLKIRDVGIEADGGNVVVTDEDQNIHHYSGNGNYRKLNGKAVTVAVNTNAIPWVINIYNNIYRRGCISSSKKLTDIPKTKENSIEVYLNSAGIDRSFDISVKGDLDNLVSIELYEASGKNVFSKKYDQRIISLSKNELGLDTGLYILKVTSGNSNRIRKLIF